MTKPNDPTTTTTTDPPPTQPVFSGKNFRVMVAAAVAKGEEGADKSLALEEEAEAEAAAAAAEEEKKKAAAAKENMEGVGVDLAPLEIGDVCHVMWRDKTTQKPARIIERRPATTTTTNTPPTQASDYDYYIHYISYDRRLDEWAKFSRFQLHTLQRQAAANKRPGSASSDGAGIGEGGDGSDGGRITRRDRRSSAASLETPHDDSTPGTTSTSTTDNTTSNNTSSSTTTTTEPTTTTTTHRQSSSTSLPDLEKEHEEITRVKNISKIRMGPCEVESWYFSPFPEEYSHLETLYVCEFCLKYTKRGKSMRKHQTTCMVTSPPGQEIYREGDLSVYEVDGKENRVYCQNLCLLAKLFLDHKTLYYAVEPFLFYIVCQVDEKGAHMVGYFSKEKVSAEEYNLACILTLPQYQKCGYGTFIISLSYELSKREDKVGSPEKPLSDLGKVSYRSYWTFILMSYFAQTSAKENVNMAGICKTTGMKMEDIISTLQCCGMIMRWKGQHVIRVNREKVQGYLKTRKRMRLCKSECLTWSPPSKKAK